MNTKTLHIVLFIFTISLVSSNIARTQNKVIKNEHSKSRLVYKNNQLQRIICTSLRNPYFNRLFKKEKYDVDWTKGEVNIRFIKTKRKYIIYKDETTFRFDSLFRIFEGLTTLEYGNHHYDTYVAYKYKESDYGPYKCYYRDYCNLPYSVEELINECDHKISWQTIIEHELITRKKYYIKGNQNKYAEDYKLSGQDMSFATDSNYIKWLFDLD